MTLGAVGCAAPGDTGESGDGESALLESTNGLSMINGLSMVNGLNSVSGGLATGLNTAHALNSTSGLSSSVGLMTTAAGRSTVSYLVRCALPSGHSLRKQDQNGTSYTVAGAMGRASGWESHASTQDDRYWVSSCLMAHINTTGQHIPIYLDGVAPLGWGRDPAFPIQEGTFIGDLFASPPVARYCGGRGFGSNVVAGRIGDNNQQGEPYSVIVKASTGSTRCDDSCARDPSGDGYTACYPYGGKAITVWRQFTSTPAMSFENGTAGFASVGGGMPATMRVSSDKALHGSHSMLVTINATGAGAARIEVPQPQGLKPGKSMTMFVNVSTSSASNRGYMAAYAQAGPVQSYHWTMFGYNADQVIPGEWNSIVVAVPTNFALSGSTIGLVINTTGPGTIYVYVDAISFDG